MSELTTRLVTTPIKQAMAKKIKANFVFVGIFIIYKLSEIKGKVNKKNFLL
jgi:3-methyladenine DNA glycosylase Tag